MLAAKIDPVELNKCRTIFNLFYVDGGESIKCMGGAEKDLKEMINNIYENLSGTEGLAVPS